MAWAFPLPGHFGSASCPIRVDHRRGAHDDLAATVAGVAAILASGAADAPAVSFYNEARGRYVSSDEWASLPWWERMLGED